MIPRAWLWLRSILLRRRLEREMDEELSAHVARATERFRAAGLEPDDARAAALREFGRLEVIKEEARDARGGRGVESVIADLRYGVRRLARTPFSTVTMIVVFALGIGANAALFLFISSIVNSPLPGVPAEDSLVRIRGIERRGPGMTIGREFSYQEYRDYASQHSLFSSVAAWSSSDVVLGVTAIARGGEETLTSGAATYVTANYFQVMGVSPSIGVGLPTDFPDEGEEPPLVAVISDAVWGRCFDRAPDVVGKTIEVNDIAVTVVGVAPRRFAGARIGGSLMRVWVPFSARSVLQRARTDLSSYDTPLLGLAARLQPAVRPSDATATVQTIAARSMELTTGAQSRGTRSADVVPMLAGNYFPPSGDTPDMVSRVSSLIIPVLILLVTCTNVSALLAGLAIARRREIAVRLSLGASRPRLVRQLLTESVLLALAAGASALAIIWILLRVFESSIADVHVVIDWRGVLFTLGVAGVAGIIFGISPALHGTRVALSDVLKDSAGGVVVPRSRLQSLLVVAQIALTQPLLLGMGALMLELREDLAKLPSPIYADRILDVRFNTNPRYGVLDERREDTVRKLRDGMAALPGVLAVVPQENVDDYFVAAIHRADRVASNDDDHADESLQVRMQSAPAGYFALMGIPVIQGRDFDDSGREDPSAIVIGAATARRWWGHADPIGRRLVSLTPNRRGNLFTVVGVVDETQGGLKDAGTEVRIFGPGVRVTGHFLVRTHAPAQPMQSTIRSVAVGVAPDLPLVSVRTLDAIESAQRRSVTRVMAAIAGVGTLALFLSAIGLYAVVAFAVGQRVREIGIRTALGADRQRVVRWFLLRGLQLCAVGMGIGLSLSVVVVRVIAAIRAEEPPDGVIGLAAVTAGVAIAVALLATWIPARRAAQIDPIVALRIE